jgi:hypothetical protein
LPLTNLDGIPPRPYFSDTLHFLLEVPLPWYSRCRRSWSESDDWTLLQSGQLLSCMWYSLRLPPVDIIPRHSRGFSISLGEGYSQGKMGWFRFGSSPRRGLRKAGGLGSRERQTLRESSQCGWHGY